MENEKVTVSFTFDLAEVEQYREMKILECSKMFDAGARHADDGLCDTYLKKIFRLKASSPEKLAWSLVFDATYDYLLEGVSKNG